MDNHEQFIDEAKELAEGKSTQELAYWAFVHAYVANHATRYIEAKLDILRGKIETNTMIICAVGIPLLLAIILGVIKLFIGA